MGHPWLSTTRKQVLMTHQNNFIQGNFPSAATVWNIFLAWNLIISQHTWLSRCNFFRIGVYGHPNSNMSRIQRKKGKMAISLFSYQPHNWPSTWNCKLHKRSRSVQQFCESVARNRSLIRLSAPPHPPPCSATSTLWGKLSCHCHSPPRPCTTKPSSGSMQYTPRREWRWGLHSWGV